MLKEIYLPKLGAEVAVPKEGAAVPKPGAVEPVPKAGAAAPKAGVVLAPKEVEPKEAPNAGADVAGVLPNKPVDGWDVAVRPKPGVADLTYK